MGKWKDGDDKGKRRSDGGVELDSERGREERWKCEC